MTTRRQVLKATGTMAGGALLVGALPGVGEAAGTASPAAAAESLPPDVPAGLFHPRQRWLRAATSGVFLHWGMRTAPGYRDGASWEAAITAGGWDPAYWVDEAVKLRADYLVLASFHSRLGYSRCWPTEIPGSASTRRDFLGELIEAAGARGVRVILYMTDDPKWHDEGGFEQLDSAAYSAHKGREVDLTTRPGFGEFSYDNFLEVMENYPGLSGFWIDNDNEYWERNGLYELIRERRPDWLLSNNNEDTPIMDTVSNEQKTGMTPAYDYPAAVLTPMPRLTEACYKLPTKGAWWYDASSGGNPTVDFALSVGRFVTNAGSSVKSLMAETAMVNGRFPADQEAFNDFMAEWLPPVWESVHDTEGGGYMYGGLQPGAWNDGAYGVVTIAKSDRTTQYVHVTTRPSGDTLAIRDNGHRILRVSDLRTGRRLRFEQRDGTVTISGITEWDPYDTVLRVRTAAAREGFYPQKTIRSTASAAVDGHGGETLTDGSFLTWWDNGGTLPVSLKLELRGRLPVRFLALNQREWSPTYSRVSFGRPEDSARIKEYEVHVSDDGRHWGTPVRTGVLESARGVRFIDLDVRRTRFVRLTVNSTWSADTAPTYFRRLRIDELRVGWGTPTARDHH